MEKEKKGGYWRKVEECFDDLIISLQRQKGNKHITWLKVKNYLLLIFWTTQKVFNNYGWIKY